MFFKSREKRYSQQELWAVMTSLHIKDQKIIEDLLNNDNAPLEFKGDVKGKGILANKDWIKRTLIQKEEDNRLRDYTQFTIQEKVYSILKPSYDTFIKIGKMKG